jgi:hypothetical protein
MRRVVLDHVCVVLYRRISVACKRMQSLAETVVCRNRCRVYLVRVLKVLCSLFGFVLLAEEGGDVKA